MARYFKFVEFFSLLIALSIIVAGNMEIIEIHTALFGAVVSLAGGVAAFKQRLGLSNE